MTDVGVWVVVPAHDEELGIARCLDALERAELPPGTTWREWLVVDDDSSDGTGSVVDGWRAAHPRRRLHVERHPERLGKSLALEAGRRWFLHAAGTDDVLVLLDADVEITPVTLAHVLSPFVEDPTLAVAWGLPRPHGPRRGRRASWFQMELVAALAAAGGPDLLRAEGRLVTLRPQRLEGFAWQAGKVVDDLQLADAVRARGVAHRSVLDAELLVRPARGWLDFHRQTERYRRSRSAASGAPGPAPSRAPLEPRAGGGLADLRIALRTLALDPPGGAAYLVARAAGVILAAVSRDDASLEHWPIARSTKGAIPPRWGEGVTAIEKLRLGVRTVGAMANWPSVLAHYGSARLHPGVERTGEVRVVLRHGPTLVAPATVGALTPILEVASDDAYRLGALTEVLGSRRIGVLDVGAHVGITTVLLHQALTVARAVCVEPSPTAAGFLRRNLGANFVVAEVVEAAVGARPGWATLEETTPADGENRIALADVHPGTCARATGVRVPVVTLAELLGKFGKEPVVLKLDCEGGEYPALAGVPPATLGQLAALLLEYHPVEGTGGWPWLAQLLTAAGLRLLWHDPDPRRSGLGMACFVRS